MEITPADKLTINSAVDTLTGKPVFELTIPIKDKQPVPDPPKRTLWDRILRKPDAPIPEPETVRVYTIHQAVTGNVMRISSHAGLLPDELTDDAGELLLSAHEHIPTMIYIVAAAIQNDRHEPSKDLQDFLLWNIDNSDMASVLTAAIGSTDMQSFLISTILTKSTVRILAPKMDL